MSMSRNIVCSIYRSLCAFSKESENVLQYFEQHDYSSERTPWPADKRVIETPDCPSLDSLTRRLLRYRANYIDDDNPIPGDQLLDTHNIRLCVEYFNRSKDDRLAQTFQDIPRYPIQQVAQYFKDYGLINEYSAVQEILDFINAVREWHRDSYLSIPATIALKLVVNSRELTPQEQQAVIDYSGFDAIFNKSKYDSTQRHALYDALATLYSDSTIKKPHLVIVAVIAKLRTSRLYRNALKGNFESNKSDFFTALGKDPETARSYREKTCLKLIHKNHIDLAEAILQKAFSTRR